jgi:phosphoglycerate dehydrogenase-like enzyme
MRAKIAVLDDYQGVAFKMADWSAVLARADVDVFSDHLDGADAVAERLLPYDIVCVMRERTPLRADMIERLPNLKLIASTGPRNASIDLKAAAARGIAVAHTGYFGSPTLELTWALILASARHIVAEAGAVRSGGWQHSIGDDLSGKTLGIIGLGNLGSQVAKIGLAFGMRVLAWSQNLTAEKAGAVGAVLVSKEALLRQSDIVSVHLVLSERTRGLIGGAELSLMKPSARLVNTSRGPIVVEAALVAALKAGQIAGAAIDVYDVEPLPADHPYRNLKHLLATPHIGYVSRALYERFYRDTVSNILAWLDGRG